MANVTVSNTAPPTPTGARVISKIAGESITGGQVLYLNATDGKVYKAAAATSGKETIYGIAMGGASASAQVYVLLAATGPLTIAASGIVVGTVYCLSETAGDICPWGDLVTGDILNIVGYGYSATQILVDINATGIVHA